MSDDKYELLRDSIPTQTCQKCRHEWKEHPRVTNEFTDMDGNRGINMFCVICPKCGTEFCWF